MLLGCIGDDFTGSSDLANTLAKHGMRTVQYTGIPREPVPADVEAGVVALKSRSIPAAQAIEQSLAALAWLQSQGCRQFFFKYCSTFDSTPDGNIGPVAEALADALDADRVIVCPAFPGTGRSLYQGHLFVNDVLLNESGMQDHPLTPMTDADIRRWLGLQVKSEIGHLPIQVVLDGSDAIARALAAERDQGRRLIVVDAIRDADLVQIGAAADDLKLITGGSGVAMGLPANFSRRGALAGGETPWSGEDGACVALAGSCSRATREQIAIHRESHPALEIVAAEVASGKTSPASAVEWALAQSGVPLIYSSADPQTVAAAQAELGREAVAEMLEGFFAETARRLRDAGVKKLLVAGGETSGAVVEGLALESLQVGPEIDPGVPALRAGPGLVVALKSGNFGAPDYFSKAAAILAATRGPRS